MPVINYLKTNLKIIIISLILLLGLVVTLYLVKNPKIFKSKADEGSIFSSTQVSPQNESDQVSCQANNCTTSTKNIRMKINLKQLEDLENEEKPSSL